MERTLKTVLFKNLLDNKLAKISTRNFVESLEKSLR